MKVSKKTTVALILIPIATSLATILGYDFVTSRLYQRPLWTGGKIIIPDALDANTTILEWGDLRIRYDLLIDGFAVAHQGIELMNIGAFPLRLQAHVEPGTQHPEWFMADEYWLFGWNREGYILSPGEIVEVTLKFMLQAEKTMKEFAVRSNKTAPFSEDFYFNMQIEAGTWSTGETFVHYCSSADYNAANLIADNKSLSLHKGMHVVLGLTNPEVHDPLYDNNNLICIGGYAANPYVAHYFSEYKIQNGRWIGGPGISEDGQIVVATKTRASGYNITGVFGMDESYSAAKAYVGYVPEPKASYILTISGSGNGTTTPEAGSYSYTEGAVASVTAIPDVGCALDCWLLDAVDVGSANPLKVTMNMNHSLECMFKEYVPAGAELLIVPEIQTWPIDAAFKASIEIRDVKDLYAYELRIYFDVTALNVIRAFYPKDHFLPSPNFEVPAVINHEEGYVLLAVTRMGDVSGCNGSGVLATIEFEALAQGTTTLRLEVTDLLDGEGDNILDFSTKDATVVIS